MAMSSPAEAGLVASVATSVAMPPALVRVDHDHLSKCTLMVHHVYEAGEGRPLLEQQGKVDDPISS
jgi:hypothetical protein